MNLPANTKLWLMRHGHIERPQERCFIGQSDLPLSLIGQRQIQNWKHDFINHGIDIILCSDLKRCVESAKILAQNHTHIVSTAKFREINLGLWESCMMEEIRTKYPEQYALRGANLHSFRPPEGESFQDLYDRVEKALTPYLKQYAGKNILLMAHAGVNRVILANYLSLPLQYVLKIPQPYACCTCLTNPS